MNVLAVMNPNVKFSGLKATLADVAKVMAENDCGAIPIVDDEKKVVGMITDRDICLAVANATRLASEIPVLQVMSKRVFSCGPDEDLDEALATMQNKKVRRLPVVDNTGRLRGILSMDDVVLHAESGKREKSALGYGQTVKTLKAIYNRPTKELIAQP